MAPDGKIPGKRLEKGTGNRPWGARQETRGKAFTRLKSRANKADGIRIMPGGFYVTERPNEVLITVLGSCVAACIRDPELGIGGMNHFMLPENPTGDTSPASEAMRFGSYAMEVLVNELLASGCIRERLEVKVFGGADLRKVSQISSNIGTNNTEFVMEYLRREKMNVVAHDLGGALPRRIHYYPSIGRIRMLLLDKPEIKKVAEEEFSLQKKIAGKQSKPNTKNTSDNDIEFF